MKIATYSKPLAAFFAATAVAFTANAGVEVISIDPEEGDVAKLETINLGMNALVANSEGEMDYSFISIVDTAQNSYGYEASFNTRTYTLSIALNSPITAQGQYAVIIPAESFLSMSGETNDDDIMIVYNVVGESESGDDTGYQLTWGTPDPAPGTVTSISKTISIPYESTASLSVYDVDSKGASVTGPDGAIDYNKIAISARSGKVSLYLNEEITAPGTYTITIPEGWAVDTNGKGVSPELSFSYVIAEPLPDLEVSSLPDPDEELYSLSEIKVIIDGYYDYELVNPSSTLATVSKDGEVVTQAFVSQGTYSMGRVSFPTLDFELFETITAPGTYVVNLPQGSIFDNESESLLGAINITYTISELPAPNFTVTPSTDTTLASLVGTIDIAFTDCLSDGLYFVDGAGSVSATVTNNEGTTVATFPVAYGESGHVTITIADDDAITAAGFYTISIPSAVIANAETDTPLGAVEITYYVGSDYTVSIDPAEGEVESLSSFTVTFDGITLVKASDDAAPKDYPYYATVDEDGVITKVAQMTANTFAGDNTMSLSIRGGSVTESGKYAIVVPTAYYTVDGAEPKAELVFYYTIAAKAVEFYCYPVLVSPEEDDTVISLDNIEFTFEARDASWSLISEGITFKHDSTKAPTLALLSDSFEIVEYNAGTVTGTDPNLVWSSYYGVNTNGAYLFTIPEGYMVATDANGNSAKSDEFMAVVYLEKPESGIDAIQVDNVNANAIFNLNGVKLNKSIDSLPAGIYIVNGAKVVVK